MTMPPTPHHAPAQARAADVVTPYGDLPEWNLADLYPAMDAPALKADLVRSESESVAFENRYKGKLAELAAGPEAGRRLAEAVRDFEALEELLGRIMSYAGLLHAGDTSDPKRSKFYGDVQERITLASSHLLFFGLELNRIPDDQLAAALKEPALAHYKPWLDDVRAEKPYQLEDRVELLFHEKSVTAYSAWNRLFDDTMSALRFNVEGKEFKDFDVWVKAGGFARAYVETVPVEITDGKLDITFTPNIENPEINGIEILPAP